MLLNGQLLHSLGFQNEFATSQRGKNVMLNKRLIKNKSPQEFNWDSNTSLNPPFSSYDGLFGLGSPKTCQLSSVWLVQFISRFCGLWLVYADPVMVRSALVMFLDGGEEAVRVRYSCFCLVCYVWSLYGWHFCLGYCQWDLSATGLVVPDNKDS